MALDEGASLTRRLANQFETAEADRLLGEAREREQQSKTPKRILADRKPFSLD